MNHNAQSGCLFVITAASGTGKTSLVKQLVSDITGLEVSISHTTRAPRPSEVDGADYHFTDKDMFLADVGAGKFIEHAQVFDNLYGTMQSTVEGMLASGVDVILEIDWQGAEQVKKLFADCLSIFILPPSIEALRQRLANRAQDSREVIEKRLAGARTEMRQYVNFDYLVVNDDFDQALAELKAIIICQRMRLLRQQAAHVALIENILNP